MYVKNTNLYNIFPSQGKYIIQNKKTSLLRQTVNQGFRY
jgi:hypothetical protein